MTIIRANNHIEEYAARARLGPGSMSGRAEQDTALVCRSVAEYIGPLPKGTIVDVGCGDGTLLSLLSGDRIGIAPSADEVARLRELQPQCRFEIGLAQRLPLSASSVSVLICNGVLLLLESEDEVRKALAEFARVCREGAVVFLGEITMEAPRPEFLHASPFVWLLTLLTRGGVKNFGAGIRDLIKAACTREPLLFYPDRWFHCTHELFVAMAAKQGLVLTRNRVTPYARSRRDYLFIRK